MPEFTREEAIAFNRDLDRYMAAETAADLRAERIESMAKDMTQPGQEYYPWTLPHFLEAVENAPEKMQILMFSCVAASVEMGLKNDHSNHLSMSAIKQLGEDYWLDAAKHEAERMIDRG